MHKTRFYENFTLPEFQKYCFYFAKKQFVTRLLSVPSSEESSVDGSWMMRNDTLQTPGALQTPQLTSTVLRENRPAEHMTDPDSEPGSEGDYVHK